MAIQELNVVEVEQVSGAVLTELLALLAFGYVANNYYNYYRAAQEGAIMTGYGQGGDVPTATASGN